MEKYAMEKLEMYVNDKGIFGHGEKWPQKSQSFQKMVKMFYCFTQSNCWRNDSSVCKCSLFTEISDELNEAGICQKTDRKPN